MDTYKEKIKLAVVAPPFSGHLYPILELALPLLKEKDKYDICVYTGFQKEEVVKKLGFSVKVLLRDKPTAFEKISDTDRQTNPLIAYKQFKENMRLMPEVIKEIEKDFIFFLSSGGGVTFSGGEPTNQLEFLRELVYYFYKKGIYTAIETCALFDFEKCKDILEKIDHIFVDIKNMDDEKHKEYTGISNKKILENVKKMATLNKSMVIRIPVIPGFNDSTENIKQTAEFVKENVKNPKMELLPYHMLGLDKYKALGLYDYIYKFEVPSKEKINDLEGVIENCGVGVVRYK